MKNNRILKLLLSALLVFSSALFAQTPPQQSKPETAAKPEAIPKETLSAIRERGKLRVCVSPYAPWVMIGEDGSLSGFSIDVAKQLAKDRSTWNSSDNFLSMAG